jgi:hypothetical protein
VFREENLSGIRSEMVISSRNPRRFLRITIYSSSAIGRKCAPLDDIFTKIRGIQFIGFT